MSLPGAVIFNREWTRMDANKAFFLSELFVSVGVCAHRRENGLILPI
jgi:hypothetical protein